MHQYSDISSKVYHLLFVTFRLSTRVSVVKHSVAVDENIYRERVAQAMHDYTHPVKPNLLSQTSSRPLL